MIRAMELLAGQSIIGTSTLAASVETTLDATAPPSTTRGGAPSPAPS